MPREIAGIPWRKPLATDEMPRCAHLHKPQTLSPSGPQVARVVLLKHDRCLWFL